MYPYNTIMSQYMPADVVEMRNFVRLYLIVKISMISTKTKKRQVRTEKYCPNYLKIGNHKNCTSTCLKNTVGAMRLIPKNTPKCIWARSIILLFPQQYHDCCKTYTPTPSSKSSSHPVKSLLTRHPGCIVALSL